MISQPPHRFGWLSKFVWVLVLGTLVFAWGCQSSKPHSQSATMVDRLANRTTTVYSTVVVRDGMVSQDRPSAEALGAFISGRTGARSSISDEKLTSTTPLASLWKSQWKEGARALDAHIDANPIDTDLAAIAVYQFLSEVGPTNIHAFLTNAKGDLLARVTINDSHEVFNEAQPRTIEDCTKLLLKVLRSRQERQR